VKKEPNGIAPEDPSIHSTKLRRKMMEKTIPGYKNAAIKVFCFHCIPLNILYTIEE
jgi:hypothetical protein